MSDDGRGGSEQEAKRGGEGRQGDAPETPRWRTALIWVVLIVVVGLAVYLGQTSDQLGAKPIAYSELKRRVQEGDVKEVAVGQGSLRATPSDKAKAKWEAEGVKEPPKLWVTGRIPPDERLLELFDANAVTYTVKADGCEGGTMLVWSLPLLFMLLFWGMILRRSGGLGGPGAQVMTFGKSRHKLYAEEGTGVGFDDVAGVDESREELTEIVAFLKSPERFHRLGGKIPKGVLLVGPPGTGKTLLAKAVAGEAGVPFYNLSGSDFVEMFVGVGASRVRDLFEQAQKTAPCIVFIDELDAIGKSRGAGAMMGGNDEREQTLNALLVEMDGFDTQSGVILLAATNRPETLDPALLRPGRFDRQVLVDRPGLPGRLAILKIHAAKIVMAEGVDLERIARQTPGFVGADLANIVNEAALLAARRDKDAVEEEDFGEAIERVIAGLEQKNRRLNPKEQKIVAYHEVGHALVAAALEHSDPVQKISIVPRGMGALGYTLQVPLDDRYLMTRWELLHKMEGLLGGRAAEELIFGDISTGAANDLQRVTDIARRMVTQYGMSPVLPNLALDEDTASPFLGRQGPRSSGRRYSEKTAQLVDREIREIIAQRYRHVLAILRANMDLLHEVSQDLLEREVLEGAPLEGFLARVVRVPDPSRGAAEQAAAPAQASAQAEASSAPGWGVGYVPKSAEARAGVDEAVGDDEAP